MSHQNSTLRKKKQGILLVNLGSPDAPTPQAVRRYLGEFLHDHRVIDTSRWIWCPILHGIILRIRPARSAKAYASIWSELEGLGDSHEGIEAPLVRITRQQAESVQTILGEDVQVEMAMRYGNPSIPDVIDKMMADGCTHIGVLPLYPQFAGATTASVFDGVANAIKGRRDIPELRFIREYFSDPDYIKVLGASVKEHVAELDWTPDVILASYHGLPKRYVDEGDPYQDECYQTTALLREETGYGEDVLKTTFQSRFGPKEWLQPYTDKTLEALPAKGIKKVCVLTPGFAADCLETLEEMSIEAREIFHEHGGEKFSFIPCLNDRTDHVAFLANLVKSRLL